jgi:molybdopterin-guanine dinucleotide biosynthesis protein A
MGLRYLESRSVPITNIQAAILAGGVSRRMGTDKALLRAEAGGPTLIEAVLSRLQRAGFNEPLLITGTPESYSFLGLRAVPDEVPGAGPLAGILSALLQAGSPRVLIVACDMPLLNPDLLRHMAGIPEDYGVLVPRWIDQAGNARIEPLHAIYTARCIDPIKRRLATGRRQVFGLYDDVSVRYIEESEMRLLDPRLESICNVNTPEEWRAITQAKGPREGA